MTETQRDTFGESRTVDLGGPVHYVDFGGPEQAPTVVLVHGLGGSHLNWDLFAPLMRPHARVLALDLPGFGRSEPGDRRTTVHDNVKVLDRFLREVAGTPVVLVGNSMGGMISILQTAGSPETVNGLVLLDAAVPGPRRALDPLVAVTFAVYAVPVLGERFLRLRRRRTTPLRHVRDMLRLCGVDPDALPPSTIDRSISLIEQREDVAGMDRAFLSATRSLLRLLVDPRSYRRSMASIDVPVLLVQGDKDRLVPVAAARDIAERHPEWEYLELPGVGHVPQLQVPDRLATKVIAWLEATASARASA
ncbi:alpha/beta hydrolase [Blastococcus sp. CT_GayMR20]|uniref:alpha/beta fold hydrolase n=1 Tax=Blastococcus sp. CT_GayMR20 TaxID=2559609 RepID=UPI0010739F64|nr:alpha/beta hydrolase [Blastococcus sp. CT_GayMR20]TFV89379.1 alpha/beta hydrolase [Blastococcus sp. CT_GayMR20]TFV89382.1 alpha/beta hydrolase [Blastococcus sp. CT_GayMR20]